ncbi:MAG: murein L,D-transpeptidase, partial [Limosilactobacillus sp.]
MQLRLKYLITIVVALLILTLGGMSWHQHMHFNRNVTINGVPVGGMTAQQAYSKVKSTKRANKVYLNGQLIYHGKATSSGISSKDQSQFTQALKKQVTFFPSGKRQNMLVWTDQIKNDPQSAAKRQAVVGRTQQLNQGRRAPV